MRNLAKAALTVVAVTCVASSAQMCSLDELGYLPSGSTTDGVFRVQYMSSEGFGHRHTFGTLYAGNRKLGSHLNTYRKNPSNPLQVLFNTYAWFDNQGAGTFFYDHSTGQLTRLGTDWYIAETEPESLWGPGGRFVVITGREHLRALDTRDLHVEQLSVTLCGDAKPRKLYFASWSPDGNRFAVVVHGFVGQRSSIEQDLIEVDARQWRGRYVATMTGRGSGPYSAWEGPGEVAWQKSGNEYHAVAAATPNDRERVYSKPLPTLCAEQGETAERDRG